MPGGRDRLFVNYTHPAQVLFEIEIPDLVKVQDGQHADLKTAEVKKAWGSVKIPRAGQETLSPNGGFVWSEERKTLSWTCYHGYETGEAPSVLGATKLSDDGTLTHSGPWHVAAPGGLYKSYWGGVLTLPRAFADRYTAGKTLALGYGVYYSICGPASRGPALGAIPDPSAGQTSVPVTALLYHPHETPAPRNGDYFNANCGFWSYQPAGPERGVWTYDDWCRAGAFVETNGVGEQLRVGNVWINEIHLMSLDLPYGGCKQSGIGRERGLHGLLNDYTEIKSIQVDVGHSRAQRGWYDLLVPKG